MRGGGSVARPRHCTQLGAPLGFRTPGLTTGLHRPPRYEPAARETQHGPPSSAPRQTPERALPLCAQRRTATTAVSAGGMALAGKYTRLRASACSG